jgi:hypothetical protein
VLRGVGGGVVLSGRRVGGVRDGHDVLTFYSINPSDGIDM